jgi:hypothetical protein
MNAFSVRRRVQFAILLQLADRGIATLPTTVVMVPGIDERDLDLALENLLDDGSIQGPTWRMESLAALAEGGRMTLTARGHQRLDEDDV